MDGVKDGNREAEGERGGARGRKASQSICTQHSRQSKIHQNPIPREHPFSSSCQILTLIFLSAEIISDFVDFTANFIGFDFIVHIVC